MASQPTVIHIDSDGNSIPSQGGLYTDAGSPQQGMVQPGNIDLTKLAPIYNPDGSYSTLNSTSFQDEKPGSPTFGKEVLVRGILNNKKVDTTDPNVMDQLRQQYYQTGQHLGVFDNGDNADAYATSIHNNWEAGKIPGVQMPNAQWQQQNGGGGNVQHIDADGNVVGQNGQLNLRQGMLQGPPPGQGPDISDVMPSGQQVGTTFAKGLPGLGATAASETGPLGMILGAAGGSQVANILKSYAPQYFSENGKAPGMGEQLSSDAQNAALEGTGQILSAGAPNIRQGVALATSKIPGIRGAVERQGLTEEQQVAADKLKSLAKRGTVPGAGIDEPKEVGKILDKSMKNNSIDMDQIEKMFKDPDLRGKISDETKDNMRQIGARMNELDDKLSSDSPNAYVSGGKLVLRYGTGPLAAHALGLPWYVGSAAGKALEIPLSKVAELSTNPTTAKALLGAMDKSTPPALANLYRDGLLRQLRGQSFMMQAPDGRTKVTIGDQGVPQLPQNPTNAPSEPSSKYKGQPPPPLPGMGELIGQSVGLRQPQAMGRFTKTPIYIDKDNMGINDEVTGGYYSRPNPKIVVRPTASSSFGEEGRVLAHEQIHALLDKYGNPVPNTPNTPLIRNLFNESDRAGNPDREIPAYMGAYKEGQVDFVTPQDRQDFVQKYIEGLPKPAQDVFNKIMKSARAANEWE